MKRIHTFYGIIVSILFAAVAVQASPGIQVSTDTVILKFKNNVQVVVIAGNGDDLSPAYTYDLNKIFKNLEYKVDANSDGTMTLIVEDTYGTRYLKDTTVVVTSGSSSSYRSEGEYDNDDSKKRRYYTKRTRKHFNIDLGINQLINEDGSFPHETNELYAVRPWGSWYVGFFFLFKTQVAGPFYLDYGGGIDWYNMKYENHRTRMDRDDLGVLFTEDSRTDINPIKSKLSATYVSLRFIPVFDFSKSRGWGRDRLWNENIGNGFRFGVGPYVGYRIDSWSKYTYREGGNKQKQHQKDNYYLNNVRYGVRFQMGFRGIDLFTTYDLNQLYSDKKDTPDVHAFAFGVTF